ncbi:SDR family oxidoreductase [Sphingomonas bacterium]|uniref:SDR family oxidoreductase n=1 Tax=Sphingomonas bacterium TaxID=1895847 RepID=UPI001576C0E4|nr:SDR family oxidoreductase [Sphingomonas bacterium]
MAGVGTRTVLVTGAARRIGSVVARVLAGEGHQVAIHHHASPDEAEALAREIGPGRAGVVTGDLADDGAGARLIADAREAMGGGPIDGLVNCASVFEFDDPTSFDPALLARLAPVNLAAPLALVAAMAAQEDLLDGAVVNVLDQKVANLNPDFLSYTLTKVALEGATTMLAQAFAPRLRVNAVSPGLTLPSADQTQEEFASVASENLLRRPVPVGEIGRTVAFLLGCPAITGQNVFVDNGQRFLARDGDVMFRDRAVRP